MNAKIVFAALIALQVSLALCEIPKPDEDVVEKYNNMKALFKRRMENVFRNIQDFIEKNEDGKAFLDANKDRSSTAKELISGVADEMEPALEKARTAALGAYSAYLRPMVGQYVQQAYDYIKPVLDKHLPAEDTPAQR